MIYFDEFTGIPRRVILNLLGFPAAQFRLISSEHVMVLPKVVTLSVQLADKASRTVALLTERLDQRRGRGQQQIMVKHVTVNADQQWSPIKLLAAEPRRVLPPC